MLLLPAEAPMAVLSAMLQPPSWELSVAVSRDLSEKGLKASCQSLQPGSAAGDCRGFSGSSTSLSAGKLSPAGAMLLSRHVKMTVAMLANQCIGSLAMSWCCLGGFLHDLLHMILRHTCVSHVFV